MFVLYWSLIDIYYFFVNYGVFRVYYYEYLDFDLGVFYMLNIVILDVKRFLMKFLLIDFKVFWVLVIMWENLWFYYFLVNMVNMVREKEDYVFE